MKSFKRRHFIKRALAFLFAFLILFSGSGIENVVLASAPDNTPSEEVTASVTGAEEQEPESSQGQSSSTTGVQITTYRYVEGEDPVKTTIYRNRNNTASAYTLTNQATNDVIESNTLQSDRAVLSFKDVPAGTYTLTMSLPEDSKMSHFYQTGNTVDSINTATIIVPEDSGSFTYYDLYLKQDPNKIEYTNITYDLNGGTLVNTKKFPSNEEGNIVITKQKYESLVQSEEWPKAFSTKDIIREKYEGKHWALNSEKGKKINNATVLRDQLIANGWSDTTLVAVWESTVKEHTVTIDPNGGTIDEAYKNILVNKGETYALASNSTSKLAKEGYTLTGYTVEGTLLDANGQAVTDIQRYKANYTPQSDVTLTAIWEVTSGQFDIRLYDDQPGVQTDKYTLKLTSSDGTEYLLSSRQYGQDYRTWTVEDLPNGTYTLSIEGFNMSEGKRYGVANTPSSFTLNDSATATIEVTFEDDKSTTFIGYEVYGEPIPAPNLPSLSPVSSTANILSVKADPNNAITITFPSGEVIKGTTNRYGNWNPTVPDGVTMNIGDTITVVATNEAGVSSEPLEYILPDLFEITGLEVNPILPEDYHNGISGKAVPGSYVTVHLPGNTSRASQADENGDWFINTIGHSSRLTPGTEIDISVAIDGLVYRNVGRYTVESVNKVTIDPNGGTIKEEYASTEVKAGETYTLPYTYKSDLAREGYSLTGYTVTEGTLLDTNGEEVTELGKYTGKFTPQSDVTLTANWEETRGKVIIYLYDDAPGTQAERYTVSLIGEDGTEYPMTSNQYGSKYRRWEVENLLNGTYKLSINGYIIESGEKKGQPDTTSSFAVNEDGTARLELGFEDDSSTTFIRYEVYGKPVPEPNTVTINPNGGTINEEYKNTLINAGETYTLPYNFTSKIAKEGYTLTGYTVEGILLDKDGKEVTEIQQYKADYTPQSDVTLTAKWEVTKGGVRINLFDENPMAQKDNYTVKLIAEDETEYELKIKHYSSGNAQWSVDDVPNGTYTLKIEGFDKPVTIEKNGGSYVLSETAQATGNGEATLALQFVDDKSTAFVRYDVKEEEKLETKVIFQLVDADNKPILDESGKQIEIPGVVPVTLKPGNVVDVRLRANKLPAGYEFVSGTSILAEKVAYGETRYVATPVKEKNTQVSVSFNWKNENGQTTHLPDVTYVAVLKDEAHADDFTVVSEGVYTYTVPADRIPEGYKLSASYVGMPSKELDEYSTAYLLVSLVPEEIDPVDPVDPVDPEEPTDPVDPEEPTDPVDPVDPTDPVDPEEPTDPVDPEEPTDPVDPEEPTDPEVTEAPKTGDDFPLYLIFMLLFSISALGVVTIYRKRQQF